MIVVRICGGLGNQLFQYAAGRALSIQYGTDLVADTRLYQKDRFRSYLLDQYFTAFSPEDVLLRERLTLPPARNRIPAFLLWRMTCGRRLRYAREAGMPYDASLSCLGPNVYLHGYWQTERYFAGIADLLHKELELRHPPDARNAAYLERLAGRVSVSMHVRRGDYVSNPKAARVHGTCSIDYYQRATKRIAEQTGEDPVFHIFSDDPEWTSQNLRLPFETSYVTHNDTDHATDDLRLMAACNHHVVANSTFSWWGAWLNPSPDKIVVACREWFRDPTKDARDLVPQDWIRV